MPWPVVMDAVIAAAARTGTVLEINAQPDRLDLTGAQVRRARDAGVKLAIDSEQLSHRSGTFLRGEPTPGPPQLPCGSSTSARS